ncbi:hypothetical protein HNR60_004046 [Rhodopseudomonas rhenobacensis]|uniref:Uncharacterized protein n=1 Tax=Rhodopseudomonas rhenobacensis TaxID=87461 RepID=A0A7W7Z754_9BRAD|nr:hypothetical protein [Rhodopseudomonas rhenobacensis]MBB5049270.1 hypothetical protein [Rhodopseudomonas rhenobacensis]
MLSEKTPASLDEIRTRVYYALQRHPLCRNVQFEVVHTPRSRKGGNWTINMHAVEPDALWEASDIVADIQDAYQLAGVPERARGAELLLGR